MSRGRFSLLAMTIALGACGACSKSSSKSDTAAAPPVGTGSTEKDKPDPPGPTDTGADDSFQLVVAASDPVAPGAAATSGLTILPGKGYHINAQLDPKLTLTPPDGLTLAKNVLTSADAQIERHTTTTDHVEVFDKVAFQFAATAKTAGSYTVPGTIKFAVCTDDNSDCEPKRRSVSFTVTAK